VLLGAGVAIFVILFFALTRGSVTSTALAMAILVFIGGAWSIWRGERRRRFDQKQAGALWRERGWDEPIEFAGRDLIWRGSVWIATDRRLVEAKRARRWRPINDPCC
jgi:cbb3-type cytochrome oxidase subunit 3